jgi:hypothetical protein
MLSILEPVRHAQIFVLLSKESKILSQQVTVMMMTLLSPMINGVNLVMKSVSSVMFVIVVESVLSASKLLEKILNTDSLPQKDSETPSNALRWIATLDHGMETIVILALELSQHQLAQLVGQS